MNWWINVGLRWKTIEEEGNWWLEHVKWTGPTKLTDLSITSVEEEGSWGLEHVEGTSPTKLTGEFKEIHVEISCLVLEKSRIILIIIDVLIV